MEGGDKASQTRQATSTPGPNKKGTLPKVVAKERNWINEKLGSALAIAPDAVNKFIFDSKANGQMVASLFFPYTPRESAESEVSKPNAISTISQVSSKSILRPKTLSFLQRETERTMSPRKLAHTLVARRQPPTLKEPEAEMDHLAITWMSPRQRLEDKQKSEGLEESESEEEDYEEGGGGDGDSGSEEGSESTCSSRSSLDVCPAFFPQERHSGVDEYFEACREAGAHPISYFADSLKHETVSLSQHLVGDLGGSCIAKALAKNAYITSLSLVGCNLCKRAGESIGEMLRENRYLTSLDLSGNPLGTAGGMAIVQALDTNVTLKNLALSNTKIGDHTMKVLCQSLMSRGSGVLVSLDVSKNNIGDKGGQDLAEVLAYSSTLRQVDLSWNNLRGVGCSAIIEAVASCSMSCLEVLNMSWNGVDDSVGEATCGFIANSKTIKYLDLSHNRLSSAFCVQLAESLKVSRSLRSLKVGFNPLGYDGCMALVNTLKENQTLRFLGVENPLGKDVDEEHIAALWEELKDILDSRSVFTQVLFEHPPRPRHGSGGNLFLFKSKLKSRKVK